MFGLTSGQIGILIFFSISAFVLVVFCFASYYIWKNCCEKKLNTSQRRVSSASQEDDLTTIAQDPERQPLLPQQYQDTTSEYLTFFNSNVEASSLTTSHPTAPPSEPLPSNGSNSTLRAETSPVSTDRSTGCNSATDHERYRSDSLPTYEESLRQQR